MIITVSLLLIVAALVITLMVASGRPSPPLWLAVLLLALVGLIGFLPVR